MSTSNASTPCATVSRPRAPTPCSSTRLRTSAICPVTRHRATTGTRPSSFPWDREPVFITRLLEDSNAEHLTWVEERRPYGDSEDWVAKTRDVINELGLGNKRIGIEKSSWFITIADFDRLQQMLPDATFVDCSMLVEEGRMIKSEAELEYMRQAATAAEAGIAAGIEASQVGVSENDVAAAVHQAQIKAGSEYTGLPCFVTAGERSFLGHVTWYRETLKAGDTVFFEIPGCINRYHSALMRNCYLGDPPERMVKATDVMVNALEESIKFIKPGVTAHEAHEHCRKSHRRRRIWGSLWTTGPPTASVSGLRRTGVRAIS